MKVEIRGVKRIKDESCCETLKKLALFSNIKNLVKQSDQ